MKLSYAVPPLALFSTLAAANPLRVTVIVDEPETAAPALATAKPIEWTDCGSDADAFQLKNITITPNPLVP
jgi:hypothetical protein